MKNNIENKPVLNKENTKVLNCIVKNSDLSATKIRKKLRWAFTPTRALGSLRSDKFISVSEAKGYSITEAGIAALAGAPKIKRKKAKKSVSLVDTAPVVDTAAAAVVTEETEIPVVTEEIPVVTEV